MPKTCTATCRTGIRGKRTDLQVGLRVNLMSDKFGLKVQGQEMTSIGEVLKVL